MQIWAGQECLVVVLEASQVGRLLPTLHERVIMLEYNASHAAERETEKLSQSNEQCRGGDPNTAAVHRVPSPRGQLGQFHHH